MDSRDRHRRAARTITEAGGEPYRYPCEKHIVVFKLAWDSGQLGWCQFVGFLS